MDSINTVCFCIFKSVILSSKRYALLLRLLCWTYDWCFLNIQNMWERNPNNQQDVNYSLVSVEVHEEPVCLLKLVCESYVWEVFVLFSVTNACHFLNKRASVLVRCVEFFSFTEGPVVLILNKQRQPDCWWKMVSQPQGFSGQS